MSAQQRDSFDLNKCSHVVRVGLVDPGALAAQQILSAGVDQADPKGQNQDHKVPADKQEQF